MAHWRRMAHVLPLAIAALLVLSSAARAETGIASWYGWREHGHLMADGRKFDALGTNAASRTLPLGTHVKITNLGNGRTALAVIEDRGPYVGHRLIDCSLGTARVLGFSEDGLARVRVDVVGPVVVAKGRVRQIVVAKKMHRSANKHRKLRA